MNTDALVENQRYEGSVLDHSTADAITTNADEQVDRQYDWLTVNNISHADDIRSDFVNASRWRAPALALGDATAILLTGCLAFLMTVIVRDAMSISWPRPLFNMVTVSGVVIVPVMMVWFFSYYWGHYTRVKPFWHEARDLVKMVIYVAFMGAGLMFMLKLNHSRLLLGLDILGLIVALPVMRSLTKSVLRKLHVMDVPLLVVGASEEVEHCADAVNSDPSLGYKIVGTVTYDVRQRMPLSHQRELETVLRQASDNYPGARLMLVLHRYDREGEQLSSIEQLAGHFRHVIVAKPMQGLSGVNAEVLSIDKHETLFVRMSAGGIGTAHQRMKRLMDLVVASTLLLLLSPLFCYIAFRISRDGGPVFYNSKRIGKDGKEFHAYKFRSMRADAEQVLQRLLATDPKIRQEWLTTFKLKNDPRITAIGEFLRRTSLDELPQLLNVLAGEMSLVGPRPILPEEADMCSVFLQGYSGVLPGMTGIWQISGRNDLDYNQRIALNLWYVRNWSFWLDFSILLRTIPVVFVRRGAY